MTTSNPFGSKRLPDLAVCVALGGGLRVVAVPHPGTRARGAVTAACGGFDLWMTDARGSIDSIFPKSRLTGEQMLLVVGMLRECPVELEDMRMVRDFLRVAVRDAQRYTYRLTPRYVPDAYRPESPKFKFAK